MLVICFGSNLPLQEKRLTSFSLHDRLDFWDYEFEASDEDNLRDNQPVDYYTNFLSSSITTRCSRCPRHRAFDAHSLSQHHRCTVRPSYLDESRQRTGGLFGPRVSPPSQSHSQSLQDQYYRSAPEQFDPYSLTLLHDMFDKIFNAIICPSLLSLLVEGDRRLPPPCSAEASGTKVSPHTLPISVKSFIVRSDISNSLESFTLDNLPFHDSELTEILEVMPSLRSLTIGDLRERNHL
ncbi:hypothetical protein PM082_011919 [Marasmius tenuissimus]|nr:hypothetical protein PM082_011919 [Marasmius tenuissimus]